ncbi:MAG: tRNA (adenosine(37)-N6)-threonylcarbamoyltransferase complex dimerization subunit type 1 TsaB [Lachnospiraceae bacterium]|jgi:tRNA threonylcarbamoyladenosine biosynthesis protein TsaB|nr:tRNA (adenosine(37)-N6)-threonylcarbamoyltransferase complex dimerization subunit type 1 TsaB [Lachnospiraceae bacterium]MEE3460838.1 tRNA (adenosine(37)-N6)-threonylcarbamoyltransferase complex dimerization subunit type 1 TsaB [Lachnospiraceae bacterium]
MKILGIDSSGTSASAAVYDTDQEKILSASMSDTGYTHSAALMPMIDQTLKNGCTDVKEIGLIAISRGPGSFTGLRIGAGTAKGLAIALGVDIAPVSTLLSLAENYAGPSDSIICSIMNARRDQVYTAAYKWSDDHFLCVLPEQACSIDELIAQLENIDAEHHEEEKKVHVNGDKACNDESIRVSFVGDGIPVFRDRIDEKLKCPHRFALPHMAKQSAASICMCAEKMLEDGLTVPVNEFKPEYLRRSQAEREAEEKKAEG